MTPEPATYMPFPPPITSIPRPPKGFVPPTGGGLRRVAPRGAEMVALPAAVSDLREFTDYAATFGKTAPPIEQVRQMFDAAHQWSATRRAMDAWDAYCRAQEEMAWAGVRAMMSRLNPSFDLAVQTDPTIATRYPNLAALLGARKAMARKGIGTRALNAKEKAQGKPPSHGATGKRLQRARGRAALLAMMAKLGGGPSADSVTRAGAEPMSAGAGGGGVGSAGASVGGRAESPGTSSGASGGGGSGVMT